MADTFFGKNVETVSTSLQNSLRVLAESEREDIKLFSMTVRRIFSKSVATLDFCFFLSRKRKSHSGGEEYKVKYFPNFSLIYKHSIFKINLNNLPKIS